MTHARSLPVGPAITATTLQAIRRRPGRGQRLPRLLAAALSGALALVVLVQGPAIGASDTLSPSARFDVLRRELNQSVRDKKPVETLAVLERMRKLPQGVKGELLFFEGHAHYQLKNWDEAYRALVAYLNALGRKGQNYNLAITLFINTEKALKAEKEGETDRLRARRGWAVAESAFDRVAAVRQAWKEKAVTFGGPKDDSAWTMARREEGGFLVAGTFHQPEDKAKKLKESRSMGLISLTRDGKMAWNRVILGTADDGAIRSITALGDGGFLIGGIHRGFQVAVRLDKNAVPVPNHKGDPWVNPYARATDDALPIVTKSSDGTVLALGTETVVKDGKSARLPFALRFTEDGKALGKTVYSGNAQRFWHAVNGAAPLPGGDVIAVGEARAQAAWDTRKGMGFLLRITSEGRLVWAQRIPAEDKSDLELTAVTPTEQGGLVAAGRQGNRILVMKTEGDGRRAWAITVPYRDLLPESVREICPIPMLGERIKEAFAGTERTLPNADRVATVRAMACPQGTPFIATTSIIRLKGGYLVLGLQGRGDRQNADIRLIAIDEAGEILWDRIYGHEGFDLATSALATEDGGAIIAGATDSMGTGGRDFLMFKVDEGGDFAPWTRLGPLQAPQPKSEPKPEAEPEPSPADKADKRDEEGAGAETTTKDDSLVPPPPPPPASDDGDAADERGQDANPETEDEQASDASIGSIIGSIFGDEDPDDPQNSERKATRPGQR